MWNFEFVFCFFLSAVKNKKKYMEKLSTDSKYQQFKFQVMPFKFGFYAFGIRRLVFSSDVECVGKSQSGIFIYVFIYCILAFYDSSVAEQTMTHI